MDPLASFRLDGKVVVVTGASSGIGRRLARAFDAAGAAVVVAARRADPLLALVEDLRRAEAVPCDVSAEGACARLVDATVDAFGRIDVVVNNAGTTEVGPALDVTPESFRRVLDVNLVAPFELARAAARVMSGEGSIVNVASIQALVAMGEIPQAAYAASKAGLLGLTRQLAVEWAPQGVRVNAIAPGWFRSELTDAMFTDDRSLQWITRRTPLRRAGAEEELDGAALFLASDASRFVTGQTLVVDGGWTTV